MNSSQIACSNVCNSQIADGSPTLSVPELTRHFQWFVQPPQAPFCFRSARPSGPTTRSSSLCRGSADCGARCPRGCPTSTWGSAPTRGSRTSSRTSAIFRGTLLKVCTVRDRFMIPIAWAEWHAAVRPSSPKEFARKQTPVLCIV